MRIDRGYQLSYDAAGNLLQDGTGTGTHTYQYDAEGRLTSVDGGATSTYIYNALGQQAEIILTGPARNFERLYDPAGQELSEFNATSPYYMWTWQNVRVGGKLVAHYWWAGAGSFANFVHLNYLGSTSMATDYSGAVVMDEVRYPWGQEWLHSGSRYDEHFAGMSWHDYASGLDPTLFRRYSSSYGRWMSPDPENTGSDPSDPQSWNAYAYVGNNPTGRTDPGGDDYYLQGNCDKYECDKQGYVLDTNGNRYVVTDQEILSGQAQIGQNGTISEGGENFTGTFFDNKPQSIDVNGTPGSAATAAGLNFFFTLSNSANDFMYAVTGAPSSVRQSFTANIEPGTDLASGTGVIAAMALPIGPGGEAEATEGQIAQASRVLATRGRASAEKALTSLEQRLTEHLAKIESANAARGFTSSMEREVRNFRGLIAAYRRVLGK